MSANEAVGAKLEQLGERWGYVEISHHPQSDDDFRWHIRNHTDEGLGPSDERKAASGETFSEALKNALNDDLDPFWSDDPGGAPDA